MEKDCRNCKFFVGNRNVGRYNVQSWYCSELKNTFERYTPCERYVKIGNPPAEEQTKDTNVMRTFESGATRNNDPDRLDYDGFLSPLVIRRFAQYMHKHRKQADGTLRAGDNWQKGIPKDEYRKSIWRHFVDLWYILRGWETKTEEGLDDIDLLCALMFNVQGLLHERLKEENKNG